MKNKILPLTVFVSVFVTVSILPGAEIAYATNVSASYTQTHYRWRNDDGSQTTATWNANLDTSTSSVSLTSIIRIRFSVEETAGASGGTNPNFSEEIQYSANATACNNGTWTSLTTSSATWKIADSANITNGDATTQQISTGSGRTFLAGSINDTSQPAQISTFSNKVTEHELSIQGNSPAVNTTYRFRATKAGTALNSYTQCAVLTTDVARTIIADGTDPSNSTIAPSAAATEVDRFSLATNSGTDTVTALTVTLGPASAYTNIATVDVQTTGGSSKCSATPSSNSVSLTSCAIAVTTTPTEYKVMITPKTHANMAAPATGASYATVATVTAYTSTNPQQGTDTDSATITVDNLSPANVTSSSVSVGDEQNSLSWTNPGDSDLSTIMVVASTTAITFVPTEGTTYSTSTLNGASKVACYGKQTSCTNTGLTNGSAYYYKIFSLDSNGNWSDSGATPTGSPATPVGTTWTQANYRFFATSTATTTADSWTARSASAANAWFDIAYGNGLFVAISYTGTDRVMTSPDGITWTSRSLPVTESWRAITYGNGLFVIVNNNNLSTVCLTSPDGITWTSRACNGSQWQSVAYGNGKFVVVGAGSSFRIQSSPDAITWTTRTSPEVNTYSSVTYGEGLFVAVSIDGTNRVMTSPDGINWTGRSAAEANSWNSVTYGNGIFVAVSYDGTNRVMTSPDGITWTARSVPEANNWYAVTYGNGLFVAVSFSGTNRVMTSSDGITWTAKAASEANVWRSVTYGNGLFVAVSEDGTNRVMTSTFAEGSPLANQDTAATLTDTGQKFTLKQLLRADSSAVSLSRSYFRLQYAQKSGTCDTSFSGETYYDVGSSTPIAWYAQDIFDDNTLATSTSDLTDSARTIRIQSNEKISSFTNSQAAIASGEDGKWQFSLYDNGAPAGTTYCLRTVKTDESSWTSRAHSADSPWVSMTYGNGIFVAVATTGPSQVMTSPDGVTWTSRTAASSKKWTGVTYGNGLFVAVSDVSGGSATGAVMTSPDGITWTSRDATSALIWSSITYGNDQFVAVADVGGGSATGAVMTSRDGITWTARNAAAAEGWESVTYGNGLFVVVSYYLGNATTVMTSPDGITWTSRTAAATADWSSVAYGNGTFVAVGTNNATRVMTSTDGITWTGQTAAELSVWSSVIYGNGRFVALSSSGTNRIMTSRDAVTWNGYASPEANSWWGLAYGNGLFVAASPYGTNRVMTSGSTTLDTYSQIPEVTTKTAGPSLSLAHYRWRNDNASDATFLAAEDTAISTNIIPGDRVRLRMTISNSGGTATGYTHLLEYSSTSCSTWVAVPSYGSAVGEHWSMDYSPYLSNSGATSNSSGLTDPATFSFVAGYSMTSANQTPALNLSNSEFTELEYAIKSTSNAQSGVLYCFRLTNAGVTTNYTYTTEPRITLSNRAVRIIGGGIGIEDIITGILRIGGILFGGHGGGDEGVGSGGQQSGGGQGGGGGNTE